MSCLPLEWVGPTCQHEMEWISISWGLTLSLIHPFASLTLSNSLKNKARTLGAREGKDWRKHWRRWRRGRGESIGNISWTPFTPQPLHCKLKKNHLHFLDNPLIHLFGMMQEKAHVKPSQVWMRNVWVKEAWILNLLLWKLSDLRVKVLPQSHGLFLSSCISKFDPKALATLSKTSLQPSHSEPSELPKLS